MDNNFKPVRVAIIGAGALGQQVAQHLSQSAGWQVAGFFDDFASPRSTTPFGPVLGLVADIPHIFATDEFDALLMGLGYNHLAARQQLYEQLAPQVPFATFVHPSAYVDGSASVGPGCFVSPGCVVDINVRLGPNTFMYSSCMLAHDVEVVGHSMLSAVVNLAGHVWLDERCYLGIGTTVSNNLRLGPDISTGAGAVVLRDLTDPGTYVGIPARKMLPKA